MKPSSLLPPLCLVVMLGLSCSAKPAPAQATSSPSTSQLTTLWEVKDPRGGTLYLTGVIPLKKEGTAPLPASMEAAFARADGLAVEVDPSITNTAQVQQLMKELGTYPEGQQLTQQVEPATVTLLARMVERLGLRPEALERLRPWLAWRMITAVGLQRAGYQMGHSVDAVFIDRARAAQKPIVALDTAETQVRKLADIPAPMQDLLLRAFLVGQELTPAEELSQLEALWRSGDAKALSRLLLPHMDNPVYRPAYEHALSALGARLPQALDDLLAQPRTYFVAVGAMHVTRPGGLIDMYRERGLSVRQLASDDLK